MLTNSRMVRSYSLFMKHVESPQLLLVKDHLRDGERVNSIFEYLESLEVIRVERTDSMVLDFFADREEPPLAMVLYLNAKCGIGIHPGRNFRLLRLHSYGASRLSEILPTKVLGCKGVTDVVAFLAATAITTRASGFYDN